MISQQKEQTLTKIINLGDYHTVVGSSEKNILVSSPEKIRKISSPERNMTDYLLETLLLLAHQNEMEQLAHQGYILWLAHQKEMEKLAHQGYIL